MGICAFAVEGMMFSPKRPKRGRVNSVFMRFSITFFPGRVSDFRLKEGESLPLKALLGSSTFHLYLTTSNPSGPFWHSIVFILSFYVSL